MCRTKFRFSRHTAEDSAAVLHELEADDNLTYT